jgi:hypothetical protein
MVSIPDMKVAVQVHFTDPLSKARGCLAKLETRLREAAEAQEEFIAEVRLLEEGLRELKRRQHEMEDKK